MTDDFGYHELARCALGFVLENESWPVFVDWMTGHHVSPESHAWLEQNPAAALAEARRQFLVHSPDPSWQRLAADLGGDNA